MSELHTYRITYEADAENPTQRTAEVGAHSAVNAGEQWAVEERWRRMFPKFPGRILKIELLPDSPERPARREWATIPVGSSAEPTEGTGRAFTPADRVDALESALRERTAERDSFERRLAGREAALDGNRLERERLATSLKETREERDRLRNELGVAKDHLDDRATTIETWRAAIDKIAADVWPGVDPASHTWTLDALVEAVRKMRAERDALQKALDHLRYAAGAYGTEDNGWVAKQIERYKEGCEEELPAERDKLRNVIGDRDALLKRIDAAKAWASKRCVEVDRAELVAILEGREP